MNLSIYIWCLLLPVYYYSYPRQIKDDRAYLQNLINKNRSVYLGDSTKVYKIYGTVFISSNRNVYGNKVKIIQLKSGVPIFNCSGQTEISIRGLNLEGVGYGDYSPTSSSLAVGIFCYGASNLLIENNFFRKFSYSAVSGLRKVNNVIFRDNFCEGPTFSQRQKYPKDNTGVTLGGSRIKIYANKITNTSQGIIIAEGSKDIEIFNNNIYDIPLEHGIYVDASCNRVKIDGNIIRNVGGCGMKVQNRNMPGTTSKDIVISNNIVTSTKTGDGILIINTESKAVYADDVTIKNNKVTDIGQDGISIRIAKNVIAENNVVENVKRAGIYLSNAYNIHLYKNNVSNIGENGIFDEGSGEYITIQKNYLKNVGLKGIDKNGLSSAILIQEGRNRKILDNWVEGNPKVTQYGLYISNADQSTIEIKNNHFEGVRDYGARFSENGSQFKAFERNSFNATVGKGKILNYRF